MRETEAPYQAECYPPDHPKLIGATSTEARIERLTKGRDIRGVITLPVEAMSGQFAPLNDLKHQQLRCGVTWLQGSTPACVTEIPPKHGITFRAGGCFGVMATGGWKCAGGHAGLRSLICLPEDREGRTHETVVHALAAFFDSKGISRRNILLRGFFGIDTTVFVHDPDHPDMKRRKKYRAILEELEKLETRARGLRGWGSKDAIVRMENGLPCVSLYHTLKAQALVNNILRVGCEKTLPVEQEFAYTRHSRLGQSRNDVFLYRL